MKQFIIFSTLLLILCCTQVVHAQLFLTMGAGTNINGTHSPYASMGFSFYSRSGIGIGIEGKVPLTDLVSAGAYASGYVGYRYNVSEQVVINPVLSYNYTHHSNDYKQMDTYTVGGGIRVSYKLLYIMPEYLDNRVYLGIGIIAKFGDHD